VKRDPSLVRLSRDHQRGLALAQRIRRALPDASEAALDALQADVIGFWETALLPHFRAECECLLARLARYLNIEADLIARTQADHLSVHSIVAALRDSPDGGDRRQRLADLGQLLHDHIRWEEAVLFEAAQSRLSAAERDALGADLAARLPEVPPPAPL
jgi:hypothetical protein